MKLKLIILALFISFAQPAFCDSFYGIFFGAGIANKYNYNVGTCAGIDYTKAIAWRIGLGFKLIYQNYSLYYDQNTQSFNNGTGLGGVTILHNSSYLFFCPKIQLHMGRRGTTHFYVDGGIGYSVGGTETLHKWNLSYWPGQVGNPYDSTINTSKNINKLVYRMGFGFKEHFIINSHWLLSLTEDASFLPATLSSTADNSNLNSYNAQIFMPAYISLFIGIDHKRYTPM